MPENKHIPEICAASRLTHARLAKVEIGETITYDELSKAAGVNLQLKRGPLMTARKLAHRQNNMIFAPVIGVGLKRLDDIGISDDMNRDRKSIHRKSARSLRKIDCVQNLAAMPEEARTRMLSNAALLGAISNASGAPAMRKVTAKVHDAKRKLELQETLGALT